MLENSHNLRKQVQRNLEVMNVLRISGISSGPESGPVLKVQRKPIALTSREKQIEDKVNFYKNKETRWAFSPKLVPSEVISHALSQKGISPEDLKIFQHLTEASMLFTKKGDTALSQEDIRKHISLPLT